MTTQANQTDNNSISRKRKQEQQHHENTNTDTDNTNTNTDSTMKPKFFGVGDAIPSTLTLDLGFPPTKVNVLEHTKGKKVILMGLPGAYTPT